ncbi:hypothetical protein [Streptomyces sp. DSM 40484]|uniref:hypothetical protein n=1 Tax=Streptomyces kroppenstedtii TaxID=3051181 RepID=UPI0028D5F9CC|nr:hypothetical protein [Streptomyces sp. DSM 40484]
MQAREEPDKAGRTPLARPPRDNAGRTADTSGGSGGNGSPRAASVLNLQRLAGNAAVSRALSGQGPQSTVSVQRSGLPPGRGTYGYRNNERLDLEDEFGSSIDGNRTHQSEHAIGFNSASRQSGQRRRTAGPAGQQIRAHENELPAYYETHRAHREHDGTGTSSRVGRTGLNSRQYRDAQEDALRRDDPFGAYAINQAGYDIPSFHSATNTTAGRQSDRSFETMVHSNPRIPYYTGPGQRQRTRRMIPQEQADLAGMRDTLRSRRYPDAQRQDELMRQYGARTPQLRSYGASDGQSLSHYPDLADSDRSHSPRELDTSYRDRSRARSRARSRGRSRARSVAPDVESMYEYGGGSTFGDEDGDRARSRSRARSRARSHVRTRSTARPDVDGFFSYGGGDPFDDGRGRGRSRSRVAARSDTYDVDDYPGSSSQYQAGTYRAQSRAAGQRSRAQSRARSVSRYDAGAETDDDYMVSSQAAPSRARSRGRRRRRVIESSSEDGW